MGKTRMEELFYELYASTKQHDSWERYAMVVELRALMKQPIRGSSRSDHFEDECDDDQTFDDKEEIHQVHETLTNPAPIEEDVSSDPICDEKELVSIDLDLQEVQTKTVAEEKLNLPKGQNIEHLVGEHFETFSTDYSSLLNLSSSNRYQKDSTWIESSLYLLCSLKDGRVWEPGGLPTKMHHWDWFEKELKPYGESHKVATFLYSQTQVVKSNLAEFKTFDRKRSDRTLPLEDKQDDEHEQNQLQDITVSHWAPDCVKQLQQGGNPIFQKVHETLWLTLPISPTNPMKKVHPQFHMVQWVWHCVKHDTQQADFHVWHRWKNKAEKLEVSLGCSGKRWSFVVYAFYDHTVAVRKEPILSLKIKRGFENKIMAGMSRGQSVKQHNGRDSENVKLYNNNIKHHYKGLVGIMVLQILSFDSLQTLRSRFLQRREI